MSDWTRDVGHGFNAHGYLADDGDRLAGALVGWLGAELGDDGDAVLQLVLRRPGGEEIGVAGMPAGAVRELCHALHRDYAAGQAARQAGARADEMAALIVAARREHQVADLGDLVAFALRDAARRLYLGAPRLVHGRPGSWEASIVLCMAEAGGTARPAGSWERLAGLFQAMGEAQNDGGQVLSDALGDAARELGGLEALAAGSVWAANLWSMAKPRNYDDPWEPDR